jgi:hypothetical protein
MRRLYIKRISLVLFGIIMALLLMRWQFPEWLSIPQQSVRFLYLILVLLMVISGACWSRRAPTPQLVRYGLLWLGIVLLLVFGYNLREMIF